MFIYNSHSGSRLGPKFLRGHKDAAEWIVFFPSPREPSAQINVGTFLTKECKVSAGDQKTVSRPLSVRGNVLLTNARRDRVCSSMHHESEHSQTSDMFWNVRRKFAFPVKEKKKSHYRICVCTFLRGRSCQVINSRPVSASCSTGIQENLIELPFFKKNIPSCTTHE